MDDTTATNSDVMPSASPLDAVELDAWDALSRDEQVRRYRAVLADPACDRIADASMDDILNAARERVAARRRG